MRHWKRGEECRDYYHKRSDNNSSDHSPCHIAGYYDPRRSWGDENLIDVAREEFCLEECRCYIGERVCYNREHHKPGNHKGDIRMSADFSDSLAQDFSEYEEVENRSNYRRKKCLGPDAKNAHDIFSHDSVKRCEHLGGGHIYFSLVS